MAGVTFTLKRVFNKGFLQFELPAGTEAREALTRLLISCRDKNNDFVTVTLSRPRKPRTTGPGSQNHHLNGHLLQICEATGNDYDTVKNEVKRIAVEVMGYPYVEFHGQLIPQRERDSSTEDCAKLIEAVHLLAADLGLILREE